MSHHDVIILGNPNERQTPKPLLDKSFLKYIKHSSLAIKQSLFNFNEAKVDENFKNYVLVHCMIKIFLLVIDLSFQTHLQRYVFFQERHNSSCQPNI